MKNEKSLERTPNREIACPFALLRDLFEFAEKEKFDSTSFSDYDDTGVYGADTFKDNLRAIALPDKFIPLVADHPGEYYIVAYENRQSNYYKPGTRERLARLSTVRKRNKSDDRVREIDLKETDPSLGNRMQITVTESVNNKSFVNLNTATGDQVDAPHGQARYMYELTPTGDKKIKSSSFKRLDEGIFPWKGGNSPVRWLRNLHVEKNQFGVAEMTYEDLYIIGRSQENRSDERAQVRTTIKGQADNPELILVEVGLVGPPTSTQILYEEVSQNIKVLVYKPLPAFENQMEIIQQDPAYGALLRNPIDVKELIKDIMFKVRLLENDWDKPQTVFNQHSPIEKPVKELNS